VIKNTGCKTNNCEHQDLNRLVLKHVIEEIQCKPWIKLLKSDQGMLMPGSFDEYMTELTAGLI